MDVGEIAGAGVVSEPIVRTDTFRNTLAAILITAFVGCLPLLIFNGVPEGSKETITYIIGQLSGMATTCLAFYFTQKMGQDAADASRALNTGKLADAIKAVASGTGNGGSEGQGAEKVADAAVVKADEVKGK